MIYIDDPLWLAFQKHILWNYSARSRAGFELAIPWNKILPISLRQRHTSGRLLISYAVTSSNRNTAALSCHSRSFVA